MAINYKVFSPTHIISIVTEGLVLIGVNYFGFVLNHLSGTAFMAVNIVGLVAMSYSAMKVAVSASGLTVENK